MDPLVVPLRSRRVKRALIAQKFNHVVPTIGLIYAGVQALHRGAHGFELVLAVVEILTSVFLIGSLARSIRASRASAPLSLQHGHPIDWVDIWAAGVLLAEAGERWHLHHHIARPILLNAVLALGLGLFHGRISAFRQRRWSMKVTDEGISVGGKPFRGIRVRWKDVSAIDITERFAEIRTRTGRVRRIDLPDLENAADVRAALREAQRRLRAAAEKAEEQVRADGAATRLT